MAERNEALKNEPIEFFFIFFIVFGIAIFVYIKYNIDAWYFMKSYIYQGLALVTDFAGEIPFYILFPWAMDGVDLISLANKDLQIHASDYASYYTSETVGISKKRNIDLAVLKMLLPYVVLYIAWVIYKTTKVVRGSIALPGVKNAMYGYMETMKEIFPYIKPALPLMRAIAKFRTLDEGWYALPKIPVMWMIDNGLLMVLDPPMAKKALFMKSQRKRFLLQKDKAYKALVNQLGRPWTSLDDLTFIEKCVMSIILPHVFGRVKDSRLINRYLLNRLDAVRAILGLRDGSGKLYTHPDIEKVKSRIERTIQTYAPYFTERYFDMMKFDEPFDMFLSAFDNISSEEQMIRKAESMISSVLLTHRYVKTITLALYDRSWMYGVLASGEILWVKEFDRDFYYILAQQGRKSCFVEACAPWSHYLAERAHGFKMLSPQVAEALRGLDEDLFHSHENYTPMEDWGDEQKLRKLVPDLNDSAPAAGANKKPNSVISML